MYSPNFLENWLRHFIVIALRISTLLTFQSQQYAGCLSLEPAIVQWPQLPPDSCSSLVEHLLLLPEGQSLSHSSYQSSQPWSLPIITVPLSCLLSSSDFVIVVYVQVAAADPITSSGRVRWIKRGCLLLCSLQQKASYLS